MPDLEVDTATLEWLTECLVGAVATEERVGAPALLFLLRRYLADGRADVAESLGAALARELDLQGRFGCESDREEWLALFSEAALASVNVPEAREVAAEAVDVLERVVAGAYRPGRGMAHGLSGATFVPGSLGDQVRSASALLTAYLLSARLPYAMLADELMQSVRRDSSGPPAAFALECEAARVCCRLAALHREDAYRRAAVLPVGADYARQAAETLSALAPSIRARGVAAAPFGLALAEWLNLQ